MLKTLIFLLLSTAILNGFQLKSRLNEAKVGDSIIYAHKSHATLVRIGSINDKEMVIEEVSGPLSMVTLDWYTKKAPKHTSWTKSVIDKASCKVIRRVSVDDAQMLETEIEFLPTLMKLELTSLKDRKKIGPEPQAGEVDNRKIWNPRIVFNSKELTAEVEAYRIQWPEDGTELAGRLIDIYIPTKEGLAYLPYWIEVYSGPLKFKIFATESYRQA